MNEDRIGPAAPDLIERTWCDRWGGMIVSIDRTYRPADVEGLAWREAGGRTLGLVTWAADGDRAEITTLEAFEAGRHIGGDLLEAAEAALLRCGVRRVTIVTTNDNLPALSLYIRRGYRLVRLDLDGMERVRRLKPGVPETGEEGIPLRDMLELEKDLRQAG